MPSNLRTRKSSGTWPLNWKSVVMKTKHDDDHDVRPKQSWRKCSLYSFLCVCVWSSLSETCHKHLLWLIWRSKTQLRPWNTHKYSLFESYNDGGTSFNRDSNFDFLCEIKFFHYIQPWLVMCSPTYVTYGVTYDINWLRPGMICVLQISPIN